MNVLEDSKHMVVKQHLRSGGDSIRDQTLSLDRWRSRFSFELPGWIGLFSWLFFLADSTIVNYH